MKKIFIVQLLALIFVVNCCSGFEYKIEKYPICSSVTFHTKHYMGVKKEFTGESAGCVLASDIYTLACQTEFARHTGEPSLIEKMFTVDGVSKVILNGYKIDVEVGEAYDLDEVIKKLEVIIKNIKTKDFSFIKLKHVCKYNETQFYVGQDVWDVVASHGKVIEIILDSTNPYPVCAEFISPRGNTLLRTYTLDGMYSTELRFKSLYPYKIKIVRDE